MKTLRTKFKYADASTRIYEFDCEDSLAPDAKGKILAINASLAGGTDGGLSSFFVSAGGASMVVIDGATVVSLEIVPLTIAPNV